jgi:hypothetical protein
MTADRVLFAALGLLDKVVTRLAARCLPWTSRSQHDAYRHGYVDGVRDGYERGRMGLPR